MRANRGGIEPKAPPRDARHDPIPTAARRSVQFSALDIVLRSFRNGGYYGYRESKAALDMFTRTLAAELAPADSGKLFNFDGTNPPW